MSNGSSVPLSVHRVTSFSILRTSAYVVILTLGILGNVFVLFALKRKRRRTANDLFILNLTVCDLLLLVCLTSDIYAELTSFPYNTIFCKALRPVSTVMFSAGIFTITTMALERHHVITKPFHPKMNSGHAWLVIGGIWMLSIALAVPLPIVTFGGVAECIESGWSAIYSSIYTVALVILQYLLPLAVITGAYTGIAVYLWKEKSSQRMRNIGGDNLTRAARRDNIQALKAVLTVVVFFAVCMLPNQLAWLLWEFGRTTHQEIANALLKVSPITAYLHSCANPFIYGTFMVYFRQEFKALLWRHLSCRCQCRCRWSSGRITEPLNNTPTQTVLHQHNNSTGELKFSTQTHRGKCVSPEGNDNDTSRLGAKRNPVFIEDEESGVQETVL